MRITSFYSCAFGCRVNEAEKEEIDRKLLAMGYIWDEANPSLYIINSCAVTAKVEREVRQLIFRTRRLFPHTYIIVTGCSATYWLKQHVYKNLPINLIVSNKEKKNLPNLLTYELSQKPSFNFQACLPARQGCTRPNRTAINSTKTNKFNQSGRYFIKIQDGCQRFCSYCIVPYLRGMPKSKPSSQIVSEINRLPQNAKEAVLTAINTEAYGVDIKEKLTDFIQQVIDKTKIQRISFGSIHPWSIDNNFFKLYKNLVVLKRFINFFHIPLQSGSDKILKLMKRDYTRGEWKEKLQILFSLNPFAQIATDVIAGFLNETKKDFEDTLSFLNSSPIAKFHIFRFSLRKDTAAYFMARTMKEPTTEEKKNRVEALIQLGRKKYAVFQQKHIGITTQGLFLEKREGEYQAVLLDNQMPAFIKTSKSLRGMIKDVKITELKQNILIGKLES